MNRKELRAHLNDSPHWNRMGKLRLEEMFHALPDDAQRILLFGDEELTPACKAEVQALAQTDAELTELIDVCLKHKVAYVSAWHLFFDTVLDG